MPYDEQLAARVRDLVREHGPAEEKRMFGGLAFLLGGHLAVCASHEGGLLVRTDGTESEELLRHEHVDPMVMGSQSSRTWLHVRDPALASEADLRAWVDRGVATATALPPKSGR